VGLAPGGDSKILLSREPGTSLAGGSLKGESWGG